MGNGSKRRQSAVVTADCGTKMLILSTKSEPEAGLLWDIVIGVTHRGTPDTSLDLSPSLALGVIVATGSSSGRHRCVPRQLRSW